MTDRALLARALAALPGGVSSPVRAFRSVGGDPPFVARGHGATLVDSEGREYLDFVGSWGPLILGHAHPAVVEAVVRAARDGLTFGATCAAEVELAERVLARFPFAGKVRFTSSGTEAVMSAVRLARGATDRARILKFDGCYHGHADALLVKGGSGLATFGTPSSAGVPAEFTALTDVLPLDDEDALSAYFAARGNQLAVAVIEPLPANAGLLVQRPDFLRLLRELCTRSGALLLFDEVISGFRVAPGGMTELTGITPDLVTVGKIVGGGMPVGAYLGAAELMERLAPLGPVYQAGTLSGNPVAMAAGIATLDELARPGTYARLDALGARWQRGWQAALAAHGVPGSVARVGSVAWCCLQAGDTPRRHDAIRPESAERYATLFRHALEHGVWLAPSAYEVSFVSLAHDEAAIDRALAVIGAALADVAARHGPPLADARDAGARAAGSRDGGGTREDGPRGRAT
ncbi:MAG TPA: glutamate-1-semialdehyde 2,1-aminomutase [Planctomycetota bacterium]|nr:glutamate-1-semialdehyde 2,1-aminomutase [Planctomycetota bacterium]